MCSAESSSRELSYAEALYEATRQEMARDDSVFVFGLGVDDAPLPKHSQIKKSARLKSLGAYSLSYAKFRLKKGLDIGKVRLSVTGNMFRQFRAVAAESGVWVVRVRPTGGSRRYAKHTNDLRPWIGISTKDRAKVRNAFIAIWDAVQ